MALTSNNVPAIRDTLLMLQEQQRLLDQIHRMNAREAAARVVRDYANQHGLLDEDVREILASMGLV